MTTRHFVPAFERCEFRLPLDGSVAVGTQPEAGPAAIAPDGTTDGVEALDRSGVDVDLSLLPYVPAADPSTPVADPVPYVNSPSRYSLLTAGTTTDPAPANDSMPISEPDTVDDYYDVDYDAGDR